MLEIFTKWGIRSLGALTALSGPEIHERFGERGALWQTLARGGDIRPMVPWVDEVPFEAALELAAPALATHPGPVVLVTNEVGLGVVPAHRSGRLFRDLLGTVNQRLAAGCDEVHLVVAGRVLKL